GQRGVAHGAVPDLFPEDLFAVSWLTMLIHGEIHSVPKKYFAFLRIVDRRDLEVFSRDVVPDIELGPVRKREAADALAGVNPPVVQGPEFRALVLGVPLAEVVAEREHPLLRACLLLVAAGAPHQRGEPVVFGGLQQHRSLRAVAGAVAFLPYPPRIDRLLHGPHDESNAQFCDPPVAELEHLSEVLAGVDMDDGE